MEVPLGIALGCVVYAICVTMLACGKMPYVCITGVRDCGCLIYGFCARLCERARARTVHVDRAHLFVETDT